MGVGEIEDRKIPDSIIVRQNGERIALEVELNQKWDIRLDNFLGRTVESIESGSISECLVITNSKAVIRNYSKSLQRQTIPLRVRKSGGVWRLDREIEVRDQVRERFSFILIPESEFAGLMHGRISEENRILQTWIDDRIGDQSAQEIINSRKNPVATAGDDQMPKEVFELE